MSERTRQIIRLAAGLMLAGILGCETTTQTANPGALPMHELAGNPKLNASTYIAHGNLLEREGSYEHAADQYRKAVELTPSSVIARNRLGVTLNKLGLHEEATEQFRAAIRLRPDQASLYNNLGFSLYLEKHYKDAAAALDKALAFDPEFRRARMNRGLVLAKMGDYEASLKEFSRAGDESEAYYNLAVIQADGGKYAEAAKSLERARAANPKFEDAQDLLRQISQLAAAQEAADRAAEQAKAAAEQAKEAEEGAEGTLPVAANGEDEEAGSAEARAIARAELEEAVGTSKTTDNEGGVQAAANIEAVGEPIDSEKQVANAAAAAQMLDEIDQLLRAITGIDYVEMAWQSEMYTALEDWINSWTGDACSYETSRMRMEEFVGPVYDWP